MAEKILMTALSPTMESGHINQWLKKEGDTFESGDVLCQVETDKASMDYEATMDGTLLKIIAQEGANVNVGDPIAISGNKGEDISGLLGKETTTDLKKEEKQKQIKQPEVETKTENKSENRIIASPLSRQLAQEKGIDLSRVKGSGPGGRIIKADIIGLQPEEKRFVAPTMPEQKPEPRQQPKAPLAQTNVSEKRMIIARRMTESKLTSPHYYLKVIINMDSLLQKRKEIIDELGFKLSLNAFFIKLVSLALLKNPLVNASWEDNTIVNHSNTDIALAVAQKDGLITPVVRNCQSKGIIEIEKELQGLIPRAREGKLNPNEYENSTFTISNLGSFGVREFTAIINPPNSAIMAIGEIYKQPVVTKTDQIVIQQSVNVTFSFDHRIIDGAVGAVFARDLKNLCEDPFKAFL